MTTVIQTTKDPDGAFDYAGLKARSRALLCAFFGTWIACVPISLLSDDQANTVLAAFDNSLRAWLLNQNSLESRVEISAILTMFCYLTSPLLVVFGYRFFSGPFAALRNRRIAKTPWALVKRSLLLPLILVVMLIANCALPNGDVFWTHGLIANSPLLMAAFKIAGFGVIGIVSGAWAADLKLLTGA